MAVAAKMPDLEDDCFEDWIQEGPKKVFRHLGERLAKPFSGDLKTVVWKKTGALVSFRQRPNDAEKMLWASGPRDACAEAIQLTRQFLRGEVALDIDHVPQQDTDKKDILCARLARRCPGEGKRGQDPPSRTRPPS